MMCTVTYRAGGVLAATCLGVVAMMAAAAPSVAQPATDPAPAATSPAPAASPAAADLTVELNKLEPREAAAGSTGAGAAGAAPADAGCRAYLVLTNDGKANYDTIQVELIQFQPDGVIGHRFAIDIGPVAASKRKVRLFDLKNVACNQIGTFLINEVQQCKVDGAAVDDCLARINVKSLVSNVQLSK